MKVRKVGVAAVASALALGGMVAGSVGVASAKKPVVQGTLQCKPSGTTTINPGLVLQSSQLPPPKFKDKGPKYVTNGAASGCTGTAIAGSAPRPTGFTLTSKAKGKSRVILTPASQCSSQVARVAKTKIVFNTGDKMKVSLTSEIGNYAYNTATNTSTPFPPCGSDAMTAQAFVGAHANDRIETRSTGVSGGKAYAGKNVVSHSVTIETLAQELGDASSGDGVTALHGDPLYSTFNIG